MTLQEQITEAIRAGRQPRVYCPLCRRKDVEIILSMGDPVLSLEVHDMPQNELVFGTASESTFIAVRCPASSQPVHEEP